MAFFKESEPTRGVPVSILPGIARIVAPNPSVMTYHGTNTYLFAAETGTIVIDPGPDDPEHVRALLSASRGRVSKILLSHTHQDHLGACAALKAETGAPTYGFHESADPNFSPDIPLKDGDVVEGLMAIHTPGHAKDHLCFGWTNGVVFTADHVMSWSSSIVSPPGGNMADYCESLRVMLRREDLLYLPGHGPPLASPRAYVEELLTRRMAREEEIADTLRGRRMTVKDLAEALYSKTDPRLKRASERNVVAHLQKLAAEGRVRSEGEVWTEAH